MAEYLGADFFDRSPLEVAPELIGAEMIVGRCAGRIVEVEAYCGDAASHFVTRRHKGVVMRDSYAQLYVYLIYGMHRCVNFTCDSQGVGAVLVRAIEPTRGLPAMRQRRGVDEVHKLGRGPGNVCQALGIDMTFDGERIGRRVKLAPREQEMKVATSPRIGISQCVDYPWRFFEAGSRFVSGKRG